MTLQPKPNLAALERNFELARHAGEFMSLVRIMLEAKGDFYQARSLAEQRRVSPRVKDLLQSDNARNIITKAAANPLSLSGNAELADYRLLVSGFVNALASLGVFDGMLAGGMRQVPIASTVGAVSVAVAGYTVGEVSAKQVSRLSLTNGVLEPQKSHSLVYVSNELLKFGGPEVQTLITKEMINAAVIAVDAGFLSLLLSGVTVGTSTGQTATAVRSDLANMLVLVTTDQTSRLFIITTPLICKMWTAMGATSTNATPAFPEMTPQGGTILNIPVIASDAVTSGQVILCDATAIAAGTDQIVLSVLQEGTIIPNDAPDSPQVAGTNVVSLWRNNLSAILAERWWGAEKLRASCVAAVSNSNSYQQGFSPP